MPGPTYCTVGSNQLEAAKRFYDELLPLAGMGPAHDHRSGGRLYASADGGVFGVLGPFDGQPATVGNGVMIGFRMDRREQVDAFHAKVLALGGTDDGAPGVRGGASYAAYCRDLDGNKLCAYTNA